MTEFTPEQQQILDNARERIKKQALDNARARLQQQPRKAEAFTRGATGRFTQNLLQIPKLIESGANAMTLPGFASLMFGQDQEKMSNILPGTTSNLTKYLPDVNQIFAGAQRAGETAGALRTGDFSQFTSFDQATQQQQETTEQLQAQHPFASAAGDVTGNVATLVAGRAPFAQFMAKHPPVLPPFATQPGVTRVLDDILRSGPVKGLAKLAGRSAEAGIEGAVIAALNEGNPLEVAVYAAGAQALGGTLTGLMTELFSGGPLRAGAKLGLSAAAIASLIQIGKEVVPGGRDRIIESLQTGYSKVMWTMLLGTLAGMAGFGRLRGSRWEQDLPVLMDAFTAIPRTAVISTINEILKEEENGNPVPEQILNKITEDPEYFGEATPKLEKALNSPDESFTQAVEKMMGVDPDFKAQVLALAQPQLQELQ